MFKIPNRSIKQVLIDTLIPSGEGPGVDVGFRSLPDGIVVCEKDPLGPSLSGTFGVSATGVPYDTLRMIWTGF